MKRQLYTLLIITILSCNDHKEMLIEQNAFYKQELARSLKFEVTYLEEDIVDIFRNIERVSPLPSDDAIDPYRETELYFELERIENKFDDSSESISTIKEKLNDTIFKKYFRRNFIKYNIEIDKKFQSDSLERIYLKTIYYKIKKEVLLNILYKEMGCTSLSNPRISLSNINKVVYLSYGIWDTTSSKQILIDSMFVNGVKKPPSFDIKHTNPFILIDFNEIGKIEYFGRYQVWSPMLNDNTFISFKGIIEK